MHEQTMTSYNTNCCFTNS